MGDPGVLIALIGGCTALLTIVFGIFGTIITAKITRAEVRRVAEAAERKDEAVAAKVLGESTHKLANDNLSAAIKAKEAAENLRVEGIRELAALKEANAKELSGIKEAWTAEVIGLKAIIAEMRRPSGVGPAPPAEVAKVEVVNPEPVKVKVVRTAPRKRKP